MRKWLSPLLSLFTAVGGHLLNRRIDMVLLFLTLLIISTLFSFYATPALFMDTRHLTSATLETYYRFTGNAITLSLLSLLAASVIVSFFQAGKANERPKTGATGVVAGLLATLLSTVTVAWAGYTGISFLTSNTEIHVTASSSKDSETTSSVTTRFTFFRESVMYSGHWIDDEGLASMPGGDAYLTGKITYHGKPASGVKLHAIIDERYITQNVTTDAEGLYRIQVPEGQWMVNRIELTKWANGPQGMEFTVTANIEPPLGNEMYIEGRPYDDKGLQVTATAKPVPLSGLNLSISDNPELLFPMKKEQAANLSSDNITWTPVTDAARYQVQLHRVEREGTTTSFYPVNWVNTEHNVVPLEQFPSVEDTPGVTHEYAVKVFAFDKDGRLISDTAFMGNNTLSVSGAKLVDRNNAFNIGDMSPEEFRHTLELRQSDRKRLDAAKTLVQNELPDAARKLLDRMETDGFQTEKTLTLGMALAVEGRCGEAQQLIDKLGKDRVPECQSKFITERCPAANEGTAGAKSKQM